VLSSSARAYVLFLHLTCILYIQDEGGWETVTLIFQICDGTNGGYEFSRLTTEYLQRSSHPREDRHRGESIDQVKWYSCNHRPGEVVMAVFTSAENACWMHKFDAAKLNGNRLNMPHNCTHSPSSPYSILPTPNINPHNKHPQPHPLVLSLYAYATHPSVELPFCPPPPPPLLS
jgi:hypothetical protein